MELKNDISALEPVVGDVRALNARANTIERDLGRVEVDVKAYINRSVTIKLVVLSTPMFLGAVGLIITLLKGGIV